jgi:hypothetical protein
VSGGPQRDSLVERTRRRSAARAVRARAGAERAGHRATLSRAAIAFVLLLLLPLSMNACGEDRQPTPMVPIEPATRVETNWIGRCVDPLGVPIAGCSVLLAAVPTAVGGEPYVAQARADADGRFALPAPARDRVGPRGLVLGLRHPDFPIRIARITDPGADGGDLGTFVFRSERALEVHVLDLQGRPIAGATIDAEPLLVADWMPQAIATTLRARARTDAAGTAFLPAIHASFDGAALRVAARADGFGERVLAVERPSDARPIAIRIGPSATVRGRVVLATDAETPVRAEVALGVPDGAGTLAWQRTDTSTDGTFRLAVGTPTGTEPMRSGGPSAPPLLRVTLLEGAPPFDRGSSFALPDVPIERLTAGPLTIRLPIAILASGILVDASSGQPIPGATVRARHRLVGDPQSGLTVQPVATSDENGHFELFGAPSAIASNRLDPPGRTSVSVSSDGRSTVLVDLPLIAPDSAASHPETTVPIDPPASVVGLVTLATGGRPAAEPCADALVELFAVDESGGIARAPVAALATGADGRFRLLAPPAGSYRLRASAPERAPAWSSEFGVGRTGSVSPALPPLRAGATVLAEVASDRAALGLLANEYDERAEVTVELAPVPVDGDDPRRPRVAFATPAVRGDDSSPSEATADAGPVAVARFDQVPTGTWEVVYHFRFPPRVDIPRGQTPQSTSRTTAFDVVLAAPAGAPHCESVRIGRITVEPRSTPYTVQGSPP